MHGNTCLKAFIIILDICNLSVANFKFQKLALAELGSSASSARVLAEYLLLNWFAIWAGGQFWNALAGGQDGHASEPQLENVEQRFLRVNDGKESEEDKITLNLDCQLFM